MQPLAGGSSVELPVEQHEGAATEAARVTAADLAKSQEVEASQVAKDITATKPEPVISQDHPTDAESTIPSTPASTQAAATASPQSAKSTTRPAVPVVPVLPKVGPKETKASTSGVSDNAHTEPTKPASDSVEEQEVASEETPAASAPAPQKPKSWASLLSGSASAMKSSGAAAAAAASAASAGAAAGMAAFQNGGFSGLSRAGSESLAEALRAYRVGASSSVTQIEPRGLTNGGNMCYMNSVSNSTAPVRKHPSF